MHEDRLRLVEALDESALGLRPAPPATSRRAQSPASSRGLISARPLGGTHPSHPRRYGRRMDILERLEKIERPSGTRRRQVSSWRKYVRSSPRRKSGVRPRLARTNGRRRPSGALREALERREGTVLAAERTLVA